MTIYIGSLRKRESRQYSSISSGRCVQRHEPAKARIFARSRYRVVVVVVVLVIDVLVMVFSSRRKNKGGASSS